MTIPAYSTDLVDINDADSDTGWTELIAPYALGAGPGADGENRIQGVDCVSQATGNKNGEAFSIVYDAGSDISGSFAAGDCVFMWSVFAVGSNLYTYANNGQRLIIASNNSTLAAESWAVSGSDFRPSPYGGWYNYVVDPTHTPDVTDGGGNAGAWQWFGSTVSLLANIAKGTPHAVDVIRRGRGELIIEFGEAADYGTFVGLATENDYDNVTDGYNRWGLFQAVPGTYLWKGLMSFGNVTNVCDFRDANRSIFIDDTPKVYADFNRIEINNAGSRVDWEAINISSGGTTSKGNFEVMDDATVNFTTCVFTSMGTFGFLGNTTLIGTTFSNCGLITLGGATMDLCTVSGHAGAVALICSTLANISNTNFVSGGTGHAIEIDTPGTYSFVGNLFSGYGLDDTTDAAIYNNSGGLVTINVSGGGGAFTVHNGTSASTVVNNTKTLTIGTTDNPLIINSEVRIYRTSDDAVLAGVEDSGTTFAYDYSYTGDVPVYVHVINASYEWLRLDLTLDATGGSIPINQRIDRIYSNP